MSGHQIAIDMTHQPERLVVEGVRRMMAGYDTADAGCWELAWQFYKAELGGERARKPSSELVHYARALNAHGIRRLCLFPYNCRKLCQDECLVASLIAAAQSDDDAALTAIGSALVSETGLGETLYSAREFGSALKESGLVLETITLSDLPLDDCPLKQFASRIRH